MEQRACDFPWTSPTFNTGVSSRRSFMLAGTHTREVCTKMPTAHINNLRNEHHILPWMDCVPEHAVCRGTAPLQFESECARTEIKMTTFTNTSGTPLIRYLKNDCRVMVPFCHNTMAKSTVTPNGKSRGELRVAKGKE